MRTLLTAAVAVVVTAVLFLLMQALIKDPIVVAVDPPAVPPVGRVEAPVEPEPEETNETPPPLEPPPGIDGEPVLIPLENAVVDFDEPTPRGFGEGETFDVSFSQGNDAIPVITIAPQYPRDELIAGTEGWVRIGFTIQPDGSVANATVVGAHPRRGVFDHAALTAIRSWQFKPQRGDDGKPVASRAEYTIEFKLNDGA